jgi:hypothetical protein
MQMDSFVAGCAEVQKCGQGRYNSAEDFSMESMETDEGCTVEVEWEEGEYELLERLAAHHGLSIEDTLRYALKVACEKQGIFIEDPGPAGKP